jgi:anion-transporting  ArsA/GET3 family ATPase
VRVSALDEIIAHRRTVVCVGSGGVGKTTLAAALAVEAVSRGRRAMVCTIDPARRLADSLGIAELGNTQTRIPPEKLAAAGVQPKGELFAMMLDLKRTWDDLILKHAPPRKRDAILSNRFYQQLSSALAGSQEYVAMDKLVELHACGDYDLVILDTPPTAHALDFLDAPNRVLDLLNNERARGLLAPALRAGELGLRMFNLTGGYFVRTLSRLTGIGLLRELAAFTASLAPLYDVFRERAATVKELLRSAESAFVLVTSPDPLTVDGTISFHRLLLQDDMPVAAVIANRVNQRTAPGRAIDPEQVDQLAAFLGGASASFSTPVKERLAQALSEAEVLAEVDERELDRLAGGCAPTPVMTVGRLESDIYDIAGLWEIDRHLFSKG